MRHSRYYDPTTAQFLTPDPLLAITNDRYGHAGGDPINNNDPTGLICGESFGAGAFNPECYTSDGYKKNCTGSECMDSCNKSECPGKYSCTPNDAAYYPQEPEPPVGYDGYYINDDGKYEPFKYVSPPGPVWPGDKLQSDWPSFEEAFGEAACLYGIEAAPTGVGLLFVAGGCIYATIDYYDKD